MQVVHERCCGLDVHKKTVVACTLITLVNGEVQRHIRTFSTMTAGLLALVFLVGGPGRHSDRHGIDGNVLETGV
jgi:hypothetical protein